MTPPRIRLSQKRSIPPRKKLTIPLSRSLDILYKFKTFFRWLCFSHSGRQKFFCGWGMDFFGMFHSLAISPWWEQKTHAVKIAHSSNNYSNNNFSKTWNPNYSILKLMQILLSLHTNTHMATLVVKTSWKPVLLCIVKINVQTCNKNNLISADWCNSH